MDSSNVALRKLSRWKKDSTPLKLTKEESDGKESLKLRGTIGFVKETEGVANFETISPRRGVVPLLDLHDAEFAVIDKLVEIVFPDGTRFILEEEEVWACIAHTPMLHRDVPTQVFQAATASRGFFISSLPRLSREAQDALRVEHVIFQCHIPEIFTFSHPISFIYRVLEFLTVQTSKYRKTKNRFLGQKYINTCGGTTSTLPGLVQYQYDEG